MNTIQLEDTTQEGKMTSTIIIEETTQEKALEKKNIVNECKNDKKNNKSRSELIKKKRKRPCTSSGKKPKKIIKKKGRKTKKNIDNKKAENQDLDDTTIEDFKNPSFYAKKCMISKNPLLKNLEEKSNNICENKNNENIKFNNIEIEENKFIENINNSIRDLTKKNNSNINSDEEKEEKSNNEGKELSKDQIKNQILTILKNINIGQDFSLKQQENEYGIKLIAISHINISNGNLLVDDPIKIGIKYQMKNKVDVVELPYDLIPTEILIEYCNNFFEKQLLLF